MDHTRKLFELSIALLSEKNLYVLLEKIVTVARDFTGADAGSLYLKNNDKDRLEFKIVQTGSLNIYIGAHDSETDWRPIQLHLADGSENFRNVSAVAATTGEIILIDDCYNTSNYDFLGTREFDARNHYRTQSMIVIPLKDFDGEVIGVLQLINKINPKTRKLSIFGKFDRESSVALASQATAAIINTRLFQELERFLEKFIQSIGEAIDTKSPYTGNHVKKVGYLVKLILEAINEEHILFSGVFYTKDKMHLMEIASWLHDIGKIAVPDHIMDKATKLQLLFDKIELIAERFEIIKRDLKIELLEHKISRDFYEFELSQLESDLHFLREINSGEDFMTPAKIERVLNISKIKYKLNDLEVSLLREDDIKNLSIVRGTLTEEERIIIMNHAKMTTKILKNIPFPKKFVEAKHIASNHHEKLNGKGYPQGLSDSKLNLDDRILAIADVFEALSSADRPYKKPKKLSEIFKILSFMVKDGELDGDIIRFIYKSKIYLKYAEKKMLPEQIDEPKLFF